MWTGSVEVCSSATILGSQTMSFGPEQYAGIDEVYLEIRTPSRAPYQVRLSAKKPLGPVEIRFFGKTKNPHVGIRYGNTCVIGQLSQPDSFSLLSLDVQATCLVNEAFCAVDWRSLYVVFPALLPLTHPHELDDVDSLDAVENHSVRVAGFCMGEYCSRVFRIDESRSQKRLYLLAEE